MNIAFPALAITLLVLPGVVFAQMFCMPLPGRNGFQIKEWTALFTIGVILALPLHWMWMHIVGPYLELNASDYAGMAPVKCPVVDLPTVAFQSDVQQTVLKTLTLASDPEGKNPPDLLKWIASHKAPTVFYLISVTAFAFFYGLFWRFFSVYSRLIDIIPNNDGVPLKDPSLLEKALACEEDELVFLSFVVECSGSAYLYRGVYEAHDLDDKGDLKAFWITWPERRLLSEDSSSSPGDEVFYEIKSDHFYVAADEIQTMAFEKETIAVEEGKLSEEVNENVADVSLEKIQKLAHQFWEARSQSGADGSDIQDWYEAKSAVLEEALAVSGSSTEGESKPEAETRTGTEKKKGMLKQAKEALSPSLLLLRFIASTTIISVLLVAPWILSLSPSLNLHIKDAYVLPMAVFLSEVPYHWLVVIFLVWGIITCGNLFTPLRKSSESEKSV